MTQQPPRETDIVVITVAYASADVLPPFLSSVAKASVRELCVVVADNNPEDGSVAQIVTTTPFQHLGMTKNLGYGSAVNAAVASLGPNVSWLVIANPDVLISPGAVDRLIERAEADPRIALVGPQIVDESGTIYPSARALPSLRNGIGHALLVNLWPANPWSRAYRNQDLSPSAPRTTGWLSGSFFLARRSAFDQVGGFDEHYFMYFEDVDLGMRLGKAGWLSFYEPSARVTHSGAHSTSTNASAMTREHHDSARKFLRTKYSRWYLWPIRVLISLGLAMRFAVLRVRTGVK